MDVTVGYDGLRDAAARLRSGRQDLTSALRSLEALIDDLANSDFAPSWHRRGSRSPTGGGLPARRI